MKKITAAMALVLCSLTQSSAFAEAPAQTTAGAVVIDIEPEQCVTRCFYIRGIPVYCYEMCF